MIVKSLMKFGDKTTGATYAEQVKIEKGQVFECDDSLANERIENGLVVLVTDEEARKYVDSIVTVDKDDKEGWAVTQEEDGNVHVRPTEDDMIIDTPVEKIEELSKLGTVQISDSDKSEISEIEDLSYSELQETAKQLNLKYVGVSRENLIKSIKEYQKKQEELKKVKNNEK